MKRADKQYFIGQAAIAVSENLKVDDKSLYRPGSPSAILDDGTPGNVIGTVLARAGFSIGRKVRGTDSPTALKVVLGLKPDEKLPTEVAEVVEFIDDISENPYDGCSSKLISLLETLARQMTTVQIGRPVGRPVGSGKKKAETTTTTQEA